MQEVFQLVTPKGKKVKSPYFTSVARNSHKSTNKLELLEADGALILLPSFYQCSLYIYTYTGLKYTFSMVYNF